MATNLRADIRRQENKTKVKGPSWPHIRWSILPNVISWGSWIILTGVLNNLTNCSFGLAFSILVYSGKVRKSGGYSVGTDP